MIRLTIVPLAVLAIAAATLVPGGPADSAGGASVAVSAPASPTPNPKKDPCASSKSKWQHKQCENFNNSAPGDEYFGRMKISYLGIDNTFKDGAISAGGYTTDQRLISKLLFADEALHKWADKYPGDPQIPRSYFLGVQVFRKVYTQQGQQIAWNYMQLLIHKFPTTFYGKTIKASLDKDGFTEHWFALPQMCPTPLPKGVMPANTPSATATPPPAPGQPAIDLITPPCIEPSPVPTAGGATSPSPSPSHKP